MTTGSAAIITAILDTGADLDHPDLQGRLVPGYNVLSPDDAPTDDSGHGTHIAGTIAATLNNQIGVAGVASGSRVMPIKVLDRRGLGMASNVALGMEWAADHGAKIVNMSFGTQQPLRILREAVDYARTKDIILVVAAGNEHETVPNFPGASGDAIAVAATDTADGLAWFSNSGSWIDVGAPGVSIFSTFWNGVSNYEYETGTSMAAPHVSGVIALMLTVNPTLSREQIKSILRSTADPVTDCGLGGGRVNAARAVQAAMRLPSTPASLLASNALTYDSPGAARSVYVPTLEREVNGWSSRVTIQNPTDAAANVDVRFVTSDGCEAGSATLTILPHGSFTSPVEGDYFTPAAWHGAAVITADHDVSVSVSASRPGFDSLGYDAPTSGAPVQYGPLVFRDRNGWSSTVYLQNLGTFPTSVELRYTSSESAGGAWTESAVIPPRAAHAFRLADHPTLPKGFVGAVTARTTDGQPVAMVATATNGSGGATAYTAASVGATTLYAPVVFKQRQTNGTWDTGIQLQNLGSQPAQLTVTYQPTSGAGAPVEERATVSPGGALTLYQPGNAQLPANFVGSATIQVANGQPLIGLVNEVNYERNISSAYELLSRGTRTGQAPLLENDVEGRSTGLQLQNLAATPAQVTIRYYDRVGALAALQTDTLPPGAAHTYYQPAIAGLPKGFAGSAQFTSTGDQPLAAIVNAVRY